MKDLLREANKRVVYLSGPHGSGKSTLIEKLKSEQSNVLVQDQIAHMESLQTMTERVIWRIALHAIEHRLNLVKAMEYPSSTIVGDRCFFDDIAYLRAFVQLGWVSPRQFSRWTKLMDDTYKRTDTAKPERIIVLCPQYEWNAERVRQRWEEGERIKWNEDNFTYLYAVNLEFHKLIRESRNGLLKVETTDLEERIRTIKGWLNGTKEEVIEKVETRRKEKKLLPGVTYFEEKRPSYRRTGGSD